MVDEERRKERLDRGIKARTEGLYAVTSWREVGYLLMPRAGLILVLLVAPLVVPGLYWQRVLGLAAVYALLAISYDFLAERVGLVCIGGAFMIGVGGYISGSLNYYLGLPVALTIPGASTLQWSHSCFPSWPRVSFLLGASSRAPRG
jgi:branched-chain amino acid transport system permease protein